MNFLSVLNYKNLFIVASQNDSLENISNEINTINTEKDFFDYNNSLLERISRMKKNIANIKKNKTNKKKLQSEYKLIGLAIKNNNIEKLKYLNYLKALINPIFNINVLHDEKKDTIQETVTNDCTFSTINEKLLNCETKNSTDIFNIMKNNQSEADKELSSVQMQKELISAIQTNLYGENNCEDINFLMYLNNLQIYMDLTLEFIPFIFDAEQKNQDESISEETFLLNSQ